MQWDTEDSRSKLDMMRQAVLRDCKCQKTRCLKNNCGCRKNKSFCTKICKCIDCGNRAGDSTSTESEGKEGEEEEEEVESEDEVEDEDDEEEIDEEENSDEESENDEALDELQEMMHLLTDETEDDEDLEEQFVDLLLA